MGLTIGKMTIYLVLRTCTLLTRLMLNSIDSKRLGMFDQDGAVCRSIRPSSQGAT